jgi:prepilin-type N-terminal cleavage/methylation domain-containing protein
MLWRKVLKILLRKSTRGSGFTIIEVLIVLAIAGLILLIVFLAVPALQRNSRNTQYRSEAAQLLTASKEQINNTGGAIPVASLSSCAGTCDAKTILGLTKNKNINNLLTVEAEAGTTVPPVAPAANAFARAVIRTGATCNAAANETDPGATSGIAILYNVENGAGTSTLTCLAS